MVENVALGVDAASSGARIFAFGIDAGLCGWTIRIDETFGSTAFVGISNVIGAADTRPSAILFFANGIGTAG